MFFIGLLKGSPRVKGSAPGLSYLYKVQDIRAPGPLTESGKLPRAARFQSTTWRLVCESGPCPFGTTDANTNNTFSSMEPLFLFTACSTSEVLEVDPYGLLEYVRFLRPSPPLLGERPMQ